LQEEVWPQQRETLRVVASAERELTRSQFKPVTQPVTSAGADRQLVQALSEHTSNTPVNKQLVQGA
jgi:hypothetical protein